MPPKLYRCVVRQIEHFIHIYEFYRYELNKDFLKQDDMHYEYLTSNAKRHMHDRCKNVKINTFQTTNWEFREILKYVCHQSQEHK